MNRLPIVRNPFSNTPPQRVSNGIKLRYWYYNLGNVEDLEDRYMPEPNTGCWLWLQSLDRHGYGQIDILGIAKRAHRIVYAHFRGEIPPGLVLDHLCRMRCCVNPDHLEPVTMHENLRRGNSPSARAARQTHCLHGHPFDEKNTRIARNKYRHMRVCRMCEAKRNKISVPKVRAKKQLAKKRIPIVRNSPSNPYWWGNMRFLWWEGVRRGVML